MLKKILTANFYLAAALLFASPAMAETAQDTTIKVENGVTVKSVNPEPAASPKPQLEPLFMKPIIEEPRTKPAASKPSVSPFKKSQDSNIAETIKKPAPSPEVESKSLLEKNDDISSDIKKLEANKPASGKEETAENSIGESGLPIPRFVSIKSGEANARTGPGETYPIRWVYQRKNLPVEITAEFKLWRRIKDFDGEQSWVHQALLSSNRYAILNRDAVATSKEEEGDQVARFKRGVQVKITECKQANCEVEYGRIEGWVKKKDLWGIYPDEIFDN